MQNRTAILHRTVERSKVHFLILDFYFDLVFIQPISIYFPWGLFWHVVTDVNSFSLRCLRWNTKLCDLVVRWNVKWIFVALQVCVFKCSVCFVLVSEFWKQPWLYFFLLFVRIICGKEVSCHSGVSRLKQACAFKAVFFSFPLFWPFSKQVVLKVMLIPIIILSSFLKAFWRPILVPSPTSSGMLPSPGVHVHSRTLNLPVVLCKITGKRSGSWRKSLGHLCVPHTSTTLKMSPGNCLKKGKEMKRMLFFFCRKAPFMLVCSCALLWWQSRSMLLSLRVQRRYVLQTAGRHHSTLAGCTRYLSSRGSVQSGHCAQH